MTAPLDDHSQTRLALAGLFVALARTLSAKDESFMQRFDDNLEQVYRKLEESEPDYLPAMEALRHAHEMIQGDL